MKYFFAISVVLAMSSVTPAYAQEDSTQERLDYTIVPGPTYDSEPALTSKQINPSYSGELPTNRLPLTGTPMPGSGSMHADNPTQNCALQADIIGYSPAPHYKSEVLVNGQVPGNPAGDTH